MQLKKLLALLLSAALALSLLAGCGGESVARSLLALLDGKYANVSVEMDPDLEADLRQAIRTAESENAGDDAAAIRAALETLLGSKVTFRKLGEGQQGDTAFDLIFYAGADPDKAAQSAYSQWNGTFSNLPDDGLYTAALAQVQTENGVWLLVQATVDKAGSRDDDDEPEEPEDPGYTVDEKGNYIVNASDGLQNLLTGQANEAQKITDARDSGFAGVTIELAAGSYSVNSTFTTTFKGILKGKSPDEKATIKLQAGSKGLFEQIGKEGGDPDDNGKVENITFDVQTNITDTYADTYAGIHYAGTVAGVNYGNITNCDVTINGGYTIQTTSDCSFAAAGGLVGWNDGTITACTVTINGSISATGDGIAYAGGIAGENQGNIINCDVKGSYKSTDDDADISTDTKIGSNVGAGGIAGYNQGTVTMDMDKDCSVTNCKIEAGESGFIVAAGGIVGWNNFGGTVAYDSAEDCYITATADTYTFTATDDKPIAFSPDNESVFAGTKIGFDGVAGRPVG